jgi:hypothetical protein
MMDEVKKLCNVNCYTKLSESIRIDMYTSVKVLIKEALSWSVEMCASRRMT